MTNDELAGIIGWKYPIPKILKVTYPRIPTRWRDAVWPKIEVILADIKHQPLRDFFNAHPSFSLNHDCSGRVFSPPKGNHSPEDMFRATRQVSKMISDLHAVIDKLDMTREQIAKSWEAYQELTKCEIS